MDQPPQPDQAQHAVQREGTDQSRTATPSASEETLASPTYFGPRVLGEDVCMPS